MFLIIVEQMPDSSNEQQLCFLLKPTPDSDFSWIQSVILIELKIKDLYGFECCSNCI